MVGVVALGHVVSTRCLCKACVGVQAMKFRRGGVHVHLQLIPALWIHPTLAQQHHQQPSPAHVLAVVAINVGLEVVVHVAHKMGQVKPGQLLIDASHAAYDGHSYRCLTRSSAKRTQQAHMSILERRTVVQYIVMHTVGSWAACRARTTRARVHVGSALRARELV